MQDDDLNELYHDTLNFVLSKSEEYDPLAIAAILMTISLSMYKTGLDENDYNQIVDVMSDSRSKVKTFEPQIFH
jgi:hypothetical protein